MTETALLCPGQGSQTSGMGAAFYDAWPEFREAFARLDGSLDLDLETLVFESSDDRLRETRYTQPAVFAVGVTAARATDRRFDVDPTFFAGHSLGHFTALAAAGALPAGAGAELVAERGRLMQRAGERDGPGTMVAVLLTDPGDVAEVCADYSDVSVAVYNGRRQTVVSGATDQVTAVREELSETHTARFEELDVGTAFHSPLMSSAVDPFEAALAETAFETADAPVVSDVTGDPYTDGSRARSQLATQLTNPVRWTDVVAHLDEAGVDRYVELPPAGTLAALVERAGVSGEVVTLDEPTDAREVFDSVA
ncbi:ACP S-malonyltransferase [Halobaculum sp. MBLA0143]|uniref:ACP S-malonyltransferase n=1 Tax=Halobaculum sp. MBLA0143 TaxID=3079933 RepID=UPI003524E077